MFSDGSGSVVVALYRQTLELPCNPFPECFSAVPVYEDMGYKDRALSKNIGNY